MNRVKIVISKHARVRFIQRYKLLFKESHFYSELSTDMLIKSLIDRDTVVDEWNDAPFYFNKITSKYGDTHVVKIYNKV